MAKTIIPFVPSQVQAPQFNVTLDGNTYTAVVQWNLYAQRYFLTIQSLNSSRIVTEALVGSPIGRQIAALSWADGKVTVTTLRPHGLRIGSVLRLTIADCQPEEFNGLQQCFVNTRSTFTYPLAADPGTATVMGAAESNINLVAGFFTSTLVYRAANRQFEVT